VVANLTQTHFRWRVDCDAVDNTPVWAAGEDVNWVPGPNRPARLRIQVFNAGDAQPSTAAAPSLWVSVNGGTYAAISAASFRPGAPAASLLASIVAAGGDSLGTRRLTAPPGATGTITGKYSDTATVSSNIRPGAGVWYECEWIISMAATPVQGDTYDFRVYYNSAPLDTYNVTPRVTVGASGYGARLAWLLGDNTGVAGYFGTTSLDGATSGTGNNNSAISQPSNTALTSPYHKVRFPTSNLPAVNASATSFIAGASGPIAGTAATNNAAGDSIQLGPFTGTLQAEPFVINISSRVVNGTGTRGNYRFRIWKSANADGSSATEITSGVITSANMNLSATATDFPCLCTFTPSSPVSLSNEYIFIQTEWQETVVAAAGADLRLRTNTAWIGLPTIVAGSTYSVSASEDAGVGETSGGVALAVAVLSETSPTAESSVSIIVGNVYSSAASEVATALENSDRSVIVPTAATELAAQTDGQVNIMSLLAAGTEVITTADVQDRNVIGIAIITEAFTITDGEVAVSSSVAVISETSPGGEASSGSMVAIGISAESFTGDENSTRSTLLPAVIAETSTVIETSLNVMLQVAGRLETFTTIDVQIGNFSSQTTATENAVVDDTLVGPIVRPVSATEAIDPSDAELGSLFAIGQSSDASPVGETSSALGALVGNATDALSVTESSIKNLFILTDRSEAVSPTDAETVKTTATGAVPEDFTFTEVEASILLAKAVISETSPIADSPVSIGVLGATRSEVVTLTETATGPLTAVGTRSEVLAPLETLTGRVVAVSGAQEDLATQDLITGRLVAPTPISETMVFVDFSIGGLTRTSAATEDAQVGSTIQTAMALPSSSVTETSTVLSSILLKFAASATRNEAFVPNEVVANKLLAKAARIEAFSLLDAVSSRNIAIAAILEPSSVDESSLSGKSFPQFRGETVTPTDAQFNVHNLVAVASEVFPVTGQHVGARVSFGQTIEHIQADTSRNAIVVFSPRTIEQALVHDEASFFHGITKSANESIDVGSRQSSAWVTGLGIVETISIGSSQTGGIRLPVVVTESSNVQMVVSALVGARITESVSPLANQVSTLVASLSRSENASVNSSQFAGMTSSMFLSETAQVLEGSSRGLIIGLAALEASVSGVCGLLQEHSGG
jgi:hypothetical protein